MGVYQLRCCSSAFSTSGSRPQRPASIHADRLGHGFGLCGRLHTAKLRGAGNGEGVGSARVALRSLLALGTGGTLWTLLALGTCRAGFALRSLRAGVAGISLGALRALLSLRAGVALVALWTLRACVSGISLVTLRALQCAHVDP